ncbi:hypothetical protein HDV00_000894 [Rhizophlyctis rosea]|nr:hypothetical protein HDV00_000894 [Rhizophlyctis rosea]
MCNLPPTRTTAGDAVYKERSAKLVRLVDALRDLGADLEIDLPRICVVGNQSAGKSSLIEAISQVALPRSDGTCTRCPMEVRLSEPKEDAEQEWHCEVRLHVVQNGKREALSKPESVWLVRDLTDPSQLEDKLWRAQRTALNPKLILGDLSKAASLMDKLGCDDTYITDEMNFTENTVIVKITGHGLGNLTLIDLPGIIQATESKADEVFIPLIKKLVEKYISNEKTIIAAVVSCKEDYENQEVLKLAGDHDPDGRRTIVVLTKPDTIEPDCHAIWFNQLSNSTKSTTYAVRNPPKSELKTNPSYQSSREVESIFFDTAPWKSFDRRHLLGVPNFRDRVGKMLIQAIRDSIPGIRAKADALSTECRHQLSSLPPRPTGKPHVVLRRLLDAYGRSVEEQAHARDDDGDFFRQVEAIVVGLQNAIQDTGPKYVVSAKLVDGTPDEGEEWTIRHVRAKIVKEKRRIPPGFNPPSVAHKLLEGALDSWGDLVQEALDEIRSLTEKMAYSQAERIFGQFPDLEQRARLMVRDLIEQHFQAATFLVDKLYKAERQPYLTTSDPILDLIRKATYQDLCTQLQNLKVSTSAAPATRSSSIVPIEDVLDVMALIKGYFGIMSRRFVDYVRLLIDTEFVLMFGDSVGVGLREKFDEEDDEMVEELVREGSGYEDQRTELEIRENRLKEVLRMIAEFRL